MRGGSSSGVIQPVGHKPIPPTPSTLMPALGNKASFSLKDRLPVVLTGKPA